MLFGIYLTAATYLAGALATFALIVVQTRSERSDHGYMFFVIGASALWFVTVPIEVWVYFRERRELKRQDQVAREFRKREAQHQELSDQVIQTRGMWDR